MFQEIHEILENGFAGKKVVVIGDLMLDKYLLGDVERVSPEAPVPVLHLKDEKITLGGAGNVVLNLNGLNIDVELLSTIGKDAEGIAVKKMLTEKGLSTDSILETDEKPTITKTRIVGEHQQIVRVDKENCDPVSNELESRLIKNFRRVLLNETIDAVIISDYAKGVISERLSRFIIDESIQRNIPVLVDPKGKNFYKYEQATVLMPNDKELLLAYDEKTHPDNTLEEIASKLYQKLKIGHLVVTRGEHGILHIAKNYSRNIPTRAREVFDVSGAGDTVISLTTAGLISNLSIEKSLELANLGAGYVVSKFGTHPISLVELNEVVHNQITNQQKIQDKKQLEKAIKIWRKNDKKIVFTNGCFDILHAGHIHLLREAKSEGDKLIVGINDDESVRALKGGDRPINQLKDRIEVLEAIAFVDAVIPFAESTPLCLIEQLQPDVLVKGADYEEHEIVGAAEVKANGGKVVRVSLIEGKSTSKLINQAAFTDE